MKTTVYVSVLYDCISLGPLVSFPDSIFRARQRKGLVNCLFHFRSPSFDDSHWDFAIEWNEASINYGLPPAGCTDPSTYISSDVDTNGVNLTCPNNLNWSAFGAPAKFIWREDLDLDNRVLCRFTLRQSSTSSPAATTVVVGMTALLAVLYLYY